MKEQKDFDILNKMKEPAWWIGYYPTGYCSSFSNICATGISDWWLCNSIVL